MCGQLGTFLMNSTIRCNIHHNIPTSLGGADVSVNRSRVPQSRHTHFHEWADNMQVCQVIRLLLLHAIGTQNVPDPSAVEKIWKITTVPDWTRLYRAEAFRIVSAPGGMRHAEKAARYLATHYLRELLDIQKTWQAMNNGGKFPTQDSALLSRACKFFGVASSVKAITKLLSEEWQGEWCWVKSMQEETRQSMQTVLAAAGPDATPDRAGMKRMFGKILDRQESHIRDHLGLWEKALKQKSMKGKK